MSVKEAAKNLVKLLEKIPGDRVPHYSSFKETQLQRFRIIAGLSSKTVPEKKKSLIDDLIGNKVFKDGKKNDGEAQIKAEAYTEKVLNQQSKAVNNLLNNKYLTLYKIDKKLLEPKSNPNYYKRLLKDLDKGGKEKESFIDALKTVLTGKY
ncbi:hypothetical protein PACTADRAFT_47605 [Pachysolen tannophilus NRRL Y-2460]|uniref:Uncharacterized protein n=1 Tax=Pachysolen tannophilus NRRL Y-2460 TaxID=669874 RepID=A0A1E4U166_PACTA|nr:hypothetical protein PACTADRAFT_47605 [Pachysolen tannophilus NRRL Y-2460]